MTNLIPAVQLVDGTPRVSSLSISEHFAKRHADVINSVRKVTLECPPEFNERNFSLVEYLDEKGESRPLYHLSRDGFTLVAMGFTGKRALAWKVRYIEAFNAMERALLDPPHGQPIALTPSTAADRAALRSLVNAWSQVSGQPHQALWPQVKAHFQLARIDDLPVEWIPDALAFVQGNIDALPKALPESVSAPARTFQSIDTGLDYRLFEFDSRCKSAIDVAGRFIQNYSAIHMRTWMQPHGDMLRLALENAKLHYGFMEDAAKAFHADVRLMDKLVAG